MNDKEIAKIKRDTIKEVLELINKKFLCFDPDTIKMDL